MRRHNGMKTYSKRRKHQINSEQDQWIPVADVDAHKGLRKRSAKVDAGDHPHKRQKTQASTMFLTSSPFETPHPSSEAQSQIYKLPSSKPQSAFTPFSPVPKQAKSIKTQNAKTQGPRTTSRNEKENSRKQRSSSKTLSSLTLSSGMKADLRYLSDAEPMEGSRKSRPSSRSSSSASSRVSSPKPDNRGRENSAPKHKTSSKTKRRTGQSSSSLQKSSKLASPFVSRSSSPVDQEKDAHISTQNTLSRSGKTDMGPPAPPTAANRRTGPSEKHFDPNVHYKRPRLSLTTRSTTLISVSTQNSPEKPIFDHKAYTNQNDKKVLRELQRRPSAPSSLQRFAKVVSKPFIPSRLAAKISPPKADTKDSSQPLAAGMVVALPAGPEIAASPILKSGSEDFEPLGWMNTRPSIDFNRPPSSLSVRYGLGGIDVELDGEEPVFWSSEEDSADEDDTQANDRTLKTKSSRGLFGGFDLGMKGEDFAEGIPLASTPFKDIESKLADAFVNDRKAAHAPADKCDDDEQDMELTAPLQGAPDHDLDYEDQTPWITDSIISIPTAYLQRQKKSKGEAREDQILSVGEDDNEDTSLEYTERLSSPFRLSNAESSSSDENEPLGSLPIPGGCSTAVVDSAASQTTARPSGTQRARSGTIVAKPMQASLPLTARRTRTGTIVGSAPQISDSQVQTQRKTSLADARRTRSGTIVGPLAPPSVAAGRARSGSIMRTTSLPVPVRIRDSPNHLDNRASAFDGSNGALQEVSDPIDSSHGGLLVLGEVDQSEGYADDHYAPTMLSSPDPIDFLRVPNLIREEIGIELSDIFSELPQSGDLRELAWCVADEPPSPVTDGSGFEAQGARCTGKRRKGKRGFKKAKNVLKFVTPGGRMDELGRLQNEEENLDISDDDLNTLG